MSVPRIALTGSTGFIGRELRGHSRLPKRADIRVCDDIASLAALGEWGEGATLLHLAGRFSGDRDTLWESNVGVTRRALAAFAQYGGGMVIFLSTGAVYGTAARPEGSREDDPIRPTNYYGFSKWIAEQVVHHEWGADGRPFQILRLPNVYGARQNKGVVFAMSQAIRERGEVVIEGDGEQRRDFLHVSDLLRAIECALARPQTGTFNISSPLTLTINQLADRLSQGRDVVRKRRPDNNGLRELVLDISLARRCLDFEPGVNELHLDP